MSVRAPQSQCEDRHLIGRHVPNFGPRLVDLGGGGAGTPPGRRARARRRCSRSISAPDAQVLSPAGRDADALSSCWGSATWRCRIRHRRISCRSHRRGAHRRLADRAPRSCFLLRPHRYGRRTCPVPLPAPAAAPWPPPCSPFFFASPSPLRLSLRPSPRRCFLLLPPPVAAARCCCPPLPASPCCPTAPSRSTPSAAPPALAAFRRWRSTSPLFPAARAFVVPFAAPASGPVGVGGHLIVAASGNDVLPGLRLAPLPPHCFSRSLPGRWGARADAAGFPVDASCSWRRGPEERQRDGRAG